MSFLYFIVGVLTGVIVSVLNVLAYKKEVQTYFKKLMQKKATIVEITDPIDNIDLT